MPDLPARIGPVELEPFGAKWVAVRCPSEFNELMRLKGGLREAGSWLIARQRINPLMRELRRTTDPLFDRFRSFMSGLPFAKTIAPRG
jgi:hypothetical protein